MSNNDEIICRLVEDSTSVTAEMVESADINASVNNTLIITEKDHRELEHRDAANQHPISAITNLQSTLDSKANQATTYTKIEVDTALATKQNTLTAGNNIQINNNTISATDTTYTAGVGISISAENVISNTQTSAEWGNITGTLSNQTDLQTALDAKANQSTTYTKTETDTLLGTKQDTINDLSTIRSGASLGATSIQPNDNVSELTNDAGYITKDVNNLTNYTKTSDLGTLATKDSVNYTTEVTNKPFIPSVINNVISTDTTNALSANMGKVLQDEINSIKARGRYLSTWNCTTGLAGTTPTTLPYSYQAGDYFIVGVVGTTNYKPNGTTYTGVASTTVETNTVKVNDTYLYDGSTWTLLHGAEVEVTFASIAGQPTDNTNLATALNLKADKSTTYTKTEVDTALNTKQNTLTAGTNIQINGNTISATDTTYTAGTGIDITNGVISNTQTSAEWGNITGTLSSQTDLQTALNAKANSSDLATVATSGSYTDLTNKPTIPAAQIQSDWNQTDTTSLDYIKNKPTIPSAASEISYTNPSYPTVAAALDKLLYVAPTVTLSGGGTYEIGSTRSTTTLTWTVNKTITSQSLNQGIGALEASVRSYTYTTAISSNTTFTITISDGTQTKTSSTALNFRPKRYWGVSPNTTLTDAEIIALSSELTTSRTQSRTFNCSGGKYFYFAIPTSLCTGIGFKVGGLAFSDMNVVTRSFTNASGYSQNYNIYRPNNIQTGSAILVEVL